MKYIVHRRNFKCSSNEDGSDMKTTIAGHTVARKGSGDGDVEVGARFILLMQCRCELFAEAWLL